MNKEEALRCLQISKEKYKDGNTAASLKFANKAQSLCETDEGQSWLEFISKMDSTGAKSASGSSTSAGGVPTTKPRPAARPRTDSTDSSSSTARPYTPEQVKGIKRIQACKGKGDLYEILGLKKGCEDSEIKKAYRKLALQFHPDKCGAPGTDDAFKAIGHAFAVLGDPDKRSKYDRFGVDSDNPRGGGGGGGAGPGFQGFGGMGGGQQFGDEINAEDLFNMFFGGGLNTGHPGMRRRHTQQQGGGPEDILNMFFGGGGMPQGRQPQRHHHRQQQQHHQQEGQAGSSLATLFRLAPILIVFVFPLLSAMFSGIFSDAGESTPQFSFQKSHIHNMDRKTATRDVPYYVNQREWARWKVPKSRPQDMRRWEGHIEDEYKHRLNNYCHQEQERKQRNINQASGIFGWLADEKALANARAMRMPHCEELREWR